LIFLTSFRLVNETSTRKQAAPAIQHLSEFFTQVTTEQIQNQFYNLNSIDWKFGAVIADIVYTSKGPHRFSSSITPRLGDST
jgi:hypothetical protein